MRSQGEESLPQPGDGVNGPEDVDLPPNSLATEDPLLTSQLFCHFCDSIRLLRSQFNLPHPSFLRDLVTS